MAGTEPGSPAYLAGMQEIGVFTKSRGVGVADGKAEGVGDAVSELFAFGRF
jgi:hypothetical protein